MHTVTIFETLKSRLSKLNQTILRQIISLKTWQRIYTSLVLEILVDLA